MLVCMADGTCIVLTVRPRVAERLALVDHV